MEWELGQLGANLPDAPIRMCSLQLVRPELFGGRAARTGASNARCHICTSAARHGIPCATAAAASASALRRPFIKIPSAFVAFSASAASFLTLGLNAPSQVHLLLCRGQGCQQPSDEPSAEGSFETA